VVPETEHLMKTLPREILGGAPSRCRHAALTHYSQIIPHSQIIPEFEFSPPDAIGWRAIGWANWRD
jgi:hypothetical protein